MRKIIWLLVMILLAASGAASEEKNNIEPYSIGIIGGVDGPTAIFIGPNDYESEDVTEELINGCSMQLNLLSGDQEYVRLLTGNSEIAQIIDGFHADSQNGIISWKQITDTDALFSAIGTDIGSLSEAAQRNLGQRMYSASYLASMLAAQQGSIVLAATASLNICYPVNLDIPSALYIGEYGNDTGMIMGVWNNGDGMILLTASFAPGIGGSEVLDELVELFY